MSENERIDIEVTDKVSPNVRVKLLAIADAATVGYTATERLKASLAGLDASSFSSLATASTKLNNAQARLNNSNARLATTTAKVQLSQQKLATETARTANANNAAAASATRATTATIQQATAQTRLNIAQQRAAAVTAAANSATALQNRLRQQGNASTRQSIQQTQNLVYQLNDIVVGLASGQRPLTVLIQQGSQIATIFGPGRGVAGTLRLLGGTLSTIFTPLLPAIGLVAALGAGFVALQSEINLTASQQVSFGDTFKAVFQVGAAAIYDLLLPAIGAISPGFVSAYDLVKTATKDTINLVVGSFLAASDIITATYERLPAVFGQIMGTIYNTVLKGIENFINIFILGIRKIIDAYNKVAAKLRRPLLEAPKDINLSGYKAPVIKAFKEIGDEATKAFNTRLSVDYAGKAFDAVAKRAQENARKRIEEENKKKGRKTTFGDITERFRNDIAELQVVGQQRRILTAILDAQEKLHRKLTAAEREELTVLVQTLDVAKARADVLDNANKSLEEYRNTLAGANQLMREGIITAEQYALALSRTQLVNDLRAADKGLTGTRFEQQANRDEAQVTADERMVAAQKAREAGLIAEQDYADRVLAIQTQLAVDLRNLDSARYEAGFRAASDAFGSIADATAEFAGKQSGIYKAMFAVQKAASIAEAIVAINTGVANALSLPFPSNLIAAATVAAQGASIVASIQSVRGLKEGGYTGDQGRNSIAGFVPVHGQEFVVNAAATARNRPLLEALNDNKPIKGRGAAASGAAVGIQPGITVTIINQGTSKEFDVQQITRDEVRIIARDEAKAQVRKEAPATVARDLANPNGSVSKALNQNTNAARRR